MPSLKLNANNAENAEKQQKVGLDHVNKQTKKNISLNEADIYEKAKQRLYDDFIQDMTDSAIDATVSEEQILEAEKRYNQLRMKRNILFGTIVFTFVAITFFGFYNTFLKHELTYQEIAYYSNKYNGKTNFPEDGVQGYLSTNIPSLLESQFTGDANITEISIVNPVLSKISPKSNQYANVYFYVTIVTNKGEERVDCMVPMYWDGSDWSYSLAGDILFTPSYPVNYSVKVVENPNLSFNEIPKSDEDSTNRSKTFVDNFFSFLYVGNDISPYYEGPQLNIGDLSYVRMVDYTLYKENNQNGFNAVCHIQVKTGNGLTYLTTKYILIESSGNSWIIKNVL